MPQSINELIKSRKQAFRELRKLIKAVDSPQEQAERLVQRALGRKTKVPTTEDLNKISQFISQTNENLITLVMFIKTITSIFGTY